MIRADFIIRNGKWARKHRVVMRVDDDRIVFVQSPFALKDEIKAFRGAKWNPEDKQWSIENHPRNIFQIRALTGDNPYTWFEQPLIEPPEFDRPLKDHQIDIFRRCATRHYQIVAAEQGLGKTLAAIEIMERSGKKNWIYAGQAAALTSVKLEFKKWGLSPDVNIQIMSYEQLVHMIRYDFGQFEVPHGFILDESHNCKNPTAHRTLAAQSLADLIREKYGTEGYVILMSGTVTAKRPTDVWAQAEIAWPGFLREGNFNAFDYRYSIMEQYEDLDGVSYPRRIGWKEEEVARLPERLDGLMTIYRKSEHLDLPPKEFREVRLQPSKKVSRVARSLCNVAPNAITALTWTRALSSGFQYTVEQNGEDTCPVCGGTGVYAYPVDGPCPGCQGSKKVPHYDRKTVKVHTPKDDAIRELLREVSEHGRVVVTGSFRGSIDRIDEVCQSEGWAAVLVDGRGWRARDEEGNLVDLTEYGNTRFDDEKTRCVQFWWDYPGKVVWIGNPASSRFGLTLVEAFMMVFYDNSFSAEHRLQMMDRIHRIGMDPDRPAEYVDLIHLPVDQMVLETLKQNRKCELLSLGAISELMEEFDEALPVD